MNAEPQAQQRDDSFIGITKVKALAGVSKSTIRLWIIKGKFPAPVMREGNLTRWSLLECESWRAQQFAKRAERLSSAPKIQQAGSVSATVSVC